MIHFDEVNERYDLTRTIKCECGASALTKKGSSNTQIKGPQLKQGLEQQVQEGRCADSRSAVQQRSIMQSRGRQRRVVYDAKRFTSPVKRKVLALVDEARAVTFMERLRVLFNKAGIAVGIRK